MTAHREFLMAWGETGPTGPPGPVGNTAAGGLTVDAAQRCRLVKVSDDAFVRRECVTADYAFAGYQLTAEDVLVK